MLAHSKKKHPSRKASRRVFWQRAADLNGRVKWPQLKDIPKEENKKHPSEIASRWGVLTTDIEKTLSRYA
jgi:hypothetical protein